jgi:integrase
LGTAWRSRISSVCWGRGDDGVRSDDPTLRGPPKPVRGGAGSPWRRAWDDAIDRAKVRRIRPYDLRHTYASLLIAGGKNPLYIARQMGHYSAGSTLDTYGHLMESVPRRPIEWIDDLVFPEEVGLNLDLYGAPHAAVSRKRPKG